jgi:hypothetical protein
VENENLLRATLFDYLPDDASARGRHANLSIASGDRQDVALAKLNISIFVALVFQANNVSGRHTVLLSTGADDRVHTYASVKNPA